MMPSLVKSDDVRSGRKVKARHGRLQGDTGVNGLTFLFYANESDDIIGGAIKTVQHSIKN